MTKMRTTRSNIISIVIFVLLGLALLLINYFGKKSEKMAFTAEIIGVIEEIEFDQKSVPTIQVKGKNYYLYEFGLRKSSGINVGDSIYKQKNQTVLKFYKQYENGYYLEGSFRMHYQDL